jgi:hypothetical protein
MVKPITEATNSVFDRVTRLRVLVLGRSMHSFHVCGLTGLGLAVALTSALVLHLALSLPTLALLLASSVAAFVGLAIAVKVATGIETLIYYYHELTVVAAAAAVLKLMGQPLPAYLDITILGLGTFLFCGRIGCLMVGCCHGKPSTLGPCYGPEHAKAGFPSYLVGVRLFPVQLVESLWVMGTVLIGAQLAFAGDRPGEAFTWYVIAYDLGRFNFEFLRGDPDRRYLAGFSEAQYVSLGLTLAVVAAEAAGLLPLHRWHVAAPALQLAVMAACWCSRSLTSRVMRPRHVGELAEALSRLQSEDGSRVVVTTAGIHISASRIESGQRHINYYAISSASPRWTYRTARALGRVVLRLRHPMARAELIVGHNGVYHLLVGSD